MDRFRVSLAPGIILLLSGCATLPSAGPTAVQIEQARSVPSSPIKFKIIDLSASSAETISPIGVTSAPLGLASLASPGRNDLIGPGDTLTISVFEVGSRLFSGSKAEDPNPIDTSAQGQTLGEYAVQADGTINLPYLGSLLVAGRTSQDVQQMIVARMSRISQFPQAIVTLKQNITNTVFVSGQAVKPGRYSLTVAQEHLLDLVAEAGGSRDAPQDTVVRLTRGDRMMEQRLSDIIPHSDDNLKLNPGDRIDLSRKQLSYSVLGAALKPAQVPFEADKLSLAEAVARAGGPSDQLADPSAVFLFRFENVKSVTDSVEHIIEQPTVYRLNLMQPASYLVAQKFAMQDKDVLYFATARSNQAGKLAQIINQIFTPIIFARQLGK